MADIQHAASVGDVAVLRIPGAKVTYLGTVGHVSSEGMVITLDVPGMFGMVMATEFPGRTVSVLPNDRPETSIIADAMAARDFNGTFPTYADMIAFMRGAVRNQGK